MEPSSARHESALGRLAALDQPRQTQQPAPVSYQRPGQRSYRRGIRSRGPLVALALPALLGVLALMMLRNSQSTTRGVGGFVAAVLAAPLLPAFGAPIRSGGSLYVLAVVASALGWVLVGIAASRRATRRPLPTWGGYWAEYMSLALSVWVGVVLSLVASNLVMGRALL